MVTLREVHWLVLQSFVSRTQELADKPGNPAETPHKHIVLPLKIAE